MFISLYKHTESNKVTNEQTNKHDLYKFIQFTVDRQ